MTEVTRRVTAAAMALVFAIASTTFAADVDEREPGPKATGKVYRWKSKNGLVYDYRLPKTFDAAKGSRLTIVLHGSNLDHRWGFANHPADTFRPDDVVVCPDGTTENGNGGFNSLESAKDVKRFREFHEELIAKLGVKSTCLFGHSQGSFFALLYAGEEPELVNGVVAHASGSWIGTRMDKARHHQAIAGLRRYYDKRERKPADALDAALDALESGFLFHECQNWNLYDGLDAIRKGLGRKGAKRLDKRFDGVMPVLRATLDLGTDAVMRVNRGAGSF